MMIGRPAASERLARASREPVTVLVARAGMGKSAALGAYLETCAQPWVRFEMTTAHASLTRFVRGLAASLEPALPRVGRSLAIAHERAMQSPRPGDVLAAWLAEHLGAQPRTIAIDQLHHSEGDAAIASFLASVVARTRANVRWIFATRSSADLPLGMWLARGESDLPIDDDALRLSVDEARELAACLAPALDAATVERLREATCGVVAVLAFALRTLARDPAALERLAEGDVFERCAREAVAGLTPSERRLLIESAALPEIDDAFLEAADLTATSAALSVIESKAPQLFDRSRGERRLHGLFHAYLGREYDELDASTKSGCALRAADALERAGRFGDSFAYRLRHRQDAELVRAIEAHGFALLESGNGEALHEAIDALDPLLQMTSPVTLTIKAMAESRIGRFDTAESWFQLALDRAPLSLRAQIAYQYGNHLVRFFRREAVGVLESIAHDPAADAVVRTYAFAALGPAFVFERDVDAARRATDAALERAPHAGRPHLSAKTLHQAAYVALYQGDSARAKELAQLSLARAEAGGYFDIAAGALTVLCNVASDIDDDPVESLRLLEAVGDCAAKSGSLVDQLFALVSMLEIEVERNDEVAADRIDEKLRALDVTYGGRALYEALLPTQALRASWAGDFAGAYRLLAKSASQPWSDDRRALRHAEIAVYAAAAGLDAEAAAAVRETSAALAALGDVDLRVQRARLYLVLALGLLGRSEEARATLELVDASPAALSERLRSLRRAFGALVERFCGARNQHELLELFLELDARGFGGVARSLAALPLADNATHRVKRLSAAERRAMLRWADGDESAAERHLPAVISKLGSIDGAAVLRAVRWHRDAFEIAQAEAFGVVESIEHAAG